MANAQPLVAYLKADRRERQAKELKKTIATVEVLDAYYHSGSRTYKKIPIKKIGNPYYYRELSKDIYIIYIEVLDTNDEVESLNYYQARINADNDYEYRKFSETTWAVLDASSFIEVSVINNFYLPRYSSSENRVIILLTEVTAYRQQFNYHIEDVGVSNGTYTLDYKDEDGYTNGILDTIIKSINPLKSQTLDNIKREVEVSLSKLSGKVYLYPFLDLQDRKLTYRYVVEGQVAMNDIRKNNSAITLKFKSLGAILSFINQTLFFEKELQIRAHKGVKQNFHSDYNWSIKAEIRFTRNIEEALTILYYTPKEFIANFENYRLWDIVKNMLKSSITNILGINKEDIILKLLEAINLKYKNKTVFLMELLSKTGKNESVFYALYNKINGENFVKYAKFLYIVWQESLFANKEYDSFMQYDGPLLLPYKSDKFLGFYYSNTSIKFIKNDILKVTLVTDENVIEINDDDEEETSNVLINYTYHPFQPIELSNIVEESSIELPKRIPAFFLKANEDKAFWANVITAIEYTVDIATTVSGIGNIAKFRHLVKIAKVAPEVLAVSVKVVKYASIVSKIRLAGGLIEISTGTVNAIIRLSSTDNKFALALQEYLYYLELVSLSGELTVALKKGLRKKAKKALREKKAIERLRKNAKNTEELNEIDEVIEHLEEVAGQESKRIFDTIGFSSIKYEMLPKNLFKKYIDDAIIKCERQGITLKIKWIDDAHPEFRSNLLGRFGTSPISKNKKFVQLELRRPCPKITWNHEQWHLDDFLEMGYVKYRKLQIESPWVLEELVWNRIFKNRNKWSEMELMDSYLYYKSNFKKFPKIRPNIIKELENLIPKYKHLINQK